MLSENDIQAIEERAKDLGAALRDSLGRIGTLTDKLLESVQATNDARAESARLRDWICHNWVRVDREEADCMDCGEVVASGRCHHAPDCFVAPLLNPR